MNSLATLDIVRAVIAERGIFLLILDLKVRERLLIH
jgi:hypothetical protein